MRDDARGRSTERFVIDAAEILSRRAESLAHETVEESATHLIGLLLFRLGEEWYSVRVEDVREIYQEYRITAIPCVPDFVLGVVNIRGEIISVVDVAKLMGVGRVTVDFHVAPAIVIHDKDVTTAIVVDEIGDIVDVPQDSVEPPLSGVGRTHVEFIAGSVYLDGRLIGLVNVDRILEPIAQA